MAKKGFFIIGHGGSGTSLLRGLLNAHPEITCHFEQLSTAGALQSIYEWKKQAAESDFIWGNKLPLEKMWDRGWIPPNFLDIPREGFKVVWIVRRYERWVKRQIPEVARYNWQRGLALYWAIRNAYPEKIIQVSFEDLLLRTEVELTRVCDFLGIKYEKAMMDGVNDTGHYSYDYGQILTEKI